MALGITIVKQTVEGSTRKVYAELALDSSYPNAGGGNGGYPIDAAKFGLSRVEDVEFTEQKGGYLYEFNKTTKKLVVKAVAGAVAAGTNAPSAVTGSAAAPITAGSFTVVDDATPGGNPLYLNTNTQFPYLVSDLATATSNQVLVGTGAAIQVRHSATPSTDAVQVYFKKANTDGQRFVADLTALGAPAFLQVPCFSGHNFRVYHDAAASGGAAVTVDDTANIFLTGNLVGGDVTNTTIGGWSQDTAAAAAVVTGTAAAQVFTGSSGGGGAAAEVANATNLSGVTGQSVVVIGG